VLILKTAKNVFNLTKEISKHPVLHPEMIASGVVWKAVQHSFFMLKKEAVKYGDLNQILKSSTFTLQHIISFSNEISEKGAEMFTFKNLTKETEKDILQKFSQAVQRIFGSKILETLLVKFSISNNEI